MAWPEFLWVSYAPTLLRDSERGTSALLVTSKDYRGCAATRGDSHPARGYTTYIGCSQRSHSETPESESLIGWALRSQQFIWSESLEEVGEVPGAAKVPQHVVEEADCVQNLGWSDCS